MDKLTKVFACKDDIRGFGEVLLDGTQGVFVELQRSLGGWAVRGDVIVPENDDHHPLVNFAPDQVVEVATLSESPLLIAFTHCPIHGEECPNRA